MSQYNPISKTQQAERRFNRPVSLHVASAWVIERLARQHAISVTHAATVADLDPVLERYSFDEFGELA